MLLIASLAAATLAGCGDDGGTCGTSMPAPASAALVSAGSESFSYEGFHGGLNGDCPVEVGSRGSVTITGTQTGSGFPLTFCIRRETDVTATPISLADDTFIKVVDVNGKDAAGCSYGKDSAAVPSGTIAFEGFCTAGGTRFNMTLAGSIGGLKTCPGGGSSTVTLQLAGSVLVTMDQ